MTMAWLSGFISAAAPSTSARTLTHEPSNLRSPRDRGQRAAWLAQRVRASSAHWVSHKGTLGHQRIKHARPPAYVGLGDRGERLHPLFSVTPSRRDRKQGSRTCSSVSLRPFAPAMKINFSDAIRRAILPNSRQFGKCCRNTCRKWPKEYILWNLYHISSGFNGRLPFQSRSLK